MPRRKAADPQPDATAPGSTPAEETVECAASECTARFTPRRKDQRYCSATCRQRGARARKHVEAAAEVDAAAESSGSAEHELVKAVHKELGEAAGSVLGQLALQLARRMADPTVSGFSSLSKELRSLLAEAKAETQASGSEDGPAAPDPAEEDEVTRARREREEARQAAGRS